MLPGSFRNVTVDPTAARMARLGVAPVPTFPTHHTNATDDDVPFNMSTSGEVGGSGPPSGPPASSPTNAGSGSSGGVTAAKPITKPTAGNVGGSPGSGPTPSLTDERLPSIGRRYTVPSPPPDPFTARPSRGLNPAIVAVTGSSSSSSAAIVGSSSSSASASITTTTAAAAASSYAYPSTSTTSAIAGAAKTPPRDPRRHRFRRFRRRVLQQGTTPVVPATATAPGSPSSRYKVSEKVTAVTPMKKAPRPPSPILSDGDTDGIMLSSNNQENISPRALDLAAVDTSMASMALTPIRSPIASDPLASPMFPDTPLTPGEGLTPRPFSVEEHATLRVFEAARGNDVEKVREALQRTDITTSSRDEYGNSVLHIGADIGSKKMVRLALRFGADVNQRNAASNTALHVAFLHNHKSVIKYLRRHGADVTLENDAGRTCFDVLAE